MILPLMRYLQLTTERWWVRLGLWGAMGLSICAALGSYSRGAFLTLGVLTAVMVLRSRRRFVLTVGLALLLAGGVTFMPENWQERIETTKEYKVDPSVQGRFNAWQFAINLAKARPIVGGGFGAFDKSLFAEYAPNPTDVHSAHSIFFEMIGEHGYVGLAIFIMLLATSMYDAGGIRRRVRNSPDLLWAGDLGTMVQASLIAYTVAGTFLNIAFFDLPYDLFALTALLKFRASEAASDSADTKAKRRLRGAIAFRQEAVPSNSPIGRRARLGGAKRSAE
ncbi:MAG: putative O-glycosylation ligase, exosortase A system-associated [Alphaproteobacteria bacterium]